MIMPGTVYDAWVNVFVASGSPVRASPDELLTTVASFFGGDSAEVWSGSTPDDLLGSMAAAGVSKGILNVNPTGMTGSKVGIDLAQGVDVCAAADGRLVLAARPLEVTTPVAMARQVESAIGHNEVCMIRVFPAILGCNMLDRRLYPMYAVCAEAGIPVSMNVGICGPRIVSKHQHPELLEELLVDFPELVVIGAHMGHPWEALLIRLMMKFDKLYLMTSAYSPKYFDPALVSFMDSRRGIDRVIFASDWPILSHERALREARALPVSETALNNYLSENLRRVMGWS